MTLTDHRSWCESEWAEDNTRLIRERDAAEARVKELEQANHNLRMENEQVYQASAEIQTVIGQIEDENTSLEARLAALRELLQEAWEFPDFPSPGEGLVSDANDAAKQEDWLRQHSTLNMRIRAALAADEEGKE